MTGQPQEHIIVTVAADGTVTAETKGIKGTDCLDYIQILEDLLEAETTTSAYTDEYHQNTSAQHNEGSNELRQW